MTYEEIKNIISQGEGMNIEFKKSTTDITKDVYETVCAFSNREGGHILLGVKDDGTVIGVDRNRAERIGAILLHQLITRIKCILRFT